MNSARPVFSCVLIEDNEDHAFLIQKVIDKSHEIALERTFDTARDALNYLISTPRLPDVLFIDINLPDMNGFECIESLRKNSEVYNALKIVMLTTSSAERDRKRAEELSVDSYLTKPLRPERLSSLLSELQLSVERL